MYIYTYKDFIFCATYLIYKKLRLAGRIKSVEETTNTKMLVIKI
jgi:hypothetical protein